MWAEWIRRWKRSEAGNVAMIFALALPATRAASARLAAQRIAAVIGCTAFDAGRDRAPFVIEFELGAAEVAPDETPATALDRAAADLARPPA